MLNDLSGMTRSISRPITFPKPLHSSHAPIGELKEKRAGLGYLKLVLQVVQEKFVVHLRITFSVSNSKISK